MVVLGIVITVITITIVIFMVYLAYHDNIDNRNIDLGLPTKKALTLFFISDVHTRVIKENTIKEALKTKVDFVVIGGDLLEKGVSTAKLTSNLQLLNYFQVPIYFVWGNNDYEKNVNMLEKVLKKYNVTIIKNETMNFKHDSSIISLIGLDCCTVGEPDFKRATSQLIGDFSILLTHDPAGFYALTEQELLKVDFALSGHTHGGQIRLFGIGPYSRGGLKYNKSKSKPIFISEGYGFTKLPFRLGTRSECHIITLR